MLPSLSTVLTLALLLTCSSTWAAPVSSGSGSGSSSQHSGSGSDFGSGSHSDHSRPMKKARLEDTAASPRAQEAEASPVPWGDLPSGVIGKILHPSSGLDAPAIESALKASKAFNEHKSDITSATTFYYKFAKPHLRMDARDSALRVSQSLFKCGRLLPIKHNDADKKDHSEYYDGGDSDDDDDDDDEEEGFVTKYRGFWNARRAKSLYQTDLWDGVNECPAFFSGSDMGNGAGDCAEGVLAMVEGGVFPSITSIPDAFKVQLIYQTLDIPNAYDDLMTVFKDFEHKPTVHRTLEYTKYCQKLGTALTEYVDHMEKFKNVMGMRSEAEGSDAGSGEENDHDKDENDDGEEVQGFLQDKKLRTILKGGCMLYLNQIVAHTRALTYAYYREKEDKIQVKGWANLLNLPNVKDAIKKYKAVAESFHSRPITKARIDEFVERGLLIHIEFPTIKMHPSISHAFLDVQDRELFQLFLDAGFDIDRESPFIRADNTAINVRKEQKSLSKSLAGEESRLKWLLERGADVDRGYGRGWPLLNTLVPFLDVHTMPVAKLLIDAGASTDESLIDVLVDAWKVPQEEELFKYIIAHGRPDVNARSDEDTPLVSILEANTDLETKKRLTKALIPLGLKINANGDEVMGADAPAMAREKAESDPENAETYNEFADWLEEMAAQETSE